MHGTEKGPAARLSVTQANPQNDAFNRTARLITITTAFLHLPDSVPHFRTAARPYKYNEELSQQMLTRIRTKFMKLRAIFSFTLRRAGIGTFHALVLIADTWRLSTMSTKIRVRRAGEKFPPRISSTAAAHSMHAYL